MKRAAVSTDTNSGRSEKQFCPFIYRGDRHGNTSRREINVAIASARTASVRNRFPSADQRDSPGTSRPGMTQPGVGGIKD